MDYHVLLGLLAVAIGIVGYVPYIRDMLRGHTKPHAFSWLIWSILEGTAFAVTITEGGGPGAWVLGLATIVCLFVFVVALKKGDRTFPLIDWVMLGASFFAIALWAVTKDPLLSIILIAVIDAIAFVPTFRKGWHKPYEETLIEYESSALKQVIGIAALTAFSLTTALYPASLVLTNVAFVTLMRMRRKRVAKKKR
jgi:hypothetical protein